ncbi:pseudouridine synthase [Aureliella helgolandensis]|uniref:Pseudouridine synthase n=1 Tax=Aureliella helgolandensis TaxID=2527968 RepID=A0A518GGB2_9BACT|nr:pseudouridine synthase [Aureliella helgolandensis]QDV27620.1 Ribosomal large subunit pseudouridine synthase B [Aureliella helgolandensis]
MAKKRTSKPKSRTRKPAVPGEQRINKILAGAGVGSRREVEELIVQGRVEVDRQTVTDLATKVNPSNVTIKVDGVALKPFRPIYYALNKPTGVLSTNRDPSGRIRVIDLVPDKARVFSVGRLDQSSEGLILLTNDGELAQRLAHPKFRVQKTYFVVVSGQLTQDELDKLRKGVHLSEGFAKIDGAKIRRHRKGCTELEIVLSEGKNREIRRILARAGHKVVLLRRLAIGPLKLGQMPVGASRELSSSEVKALYAATDPNKRNKAAKGKSKRADGESAAAAEKSQKVKPKDQAPPIPSALEDDDEPDLLTEDFGRLGLELDDDFGDFDSDFVGDFSGSGSGSILSYDADEVTTPRSNQKSKPSQKKRASGSRARTGTGARGTKSSSTGSRESADTGTRTGGPRTGGKRASPGKRAAAGRTARPAGKRATSSASRSSAPKGKAAGRSASAKGRSSAPRGGKSGGGKSSGPRGRGGKGSQR